MDFIGTAGNDTFAGTAEADTIFGFGGNDTLSGAAGNDTLTGDDGDDVLNGGDGDDWINGGDGTDLMTGGKGNDFFTIDSVGDQIVENLNEGVDWVYSYISYTLGNNVDWMTLLGEADLTGTGNALSNTIQGNSGNNVLDGGGFADTLVGRAGNDTYYVDHDFDRVIEYAGEGTDLIYSSVSCSLNLIGIGYIEDLTLTGSANIDARGNNLANVLTGNSGNNLLYGSLGADTMSGGNGNDTYSVDNAGDWVNEGVGGGTDSVSASVSYTLTANVENLTLGGSDTLIGGAGDDSYYADHAGVSVVERAGEGNDTVYAWVTYRLPDNIENLNLTGVVNGVGNAAANIITGSQDTNYIDGMAGNDTLTGEGGRDTFVFSLSSGVDTITDYDRSENDRIDVRAYGGVMSITQSGADSVIDLGSGNMVIVQNTLVADLSGHVVW
ncbi:MAG: calcium-binding protein [Asticcacaulis sp.]|nr:calcium-binding protein [Asticcacaulis sp.]